MIISTDQLSGQDVVYQISATIAAETGIAIDKLPPLYETIDPDALESFLERSNRTDTQPEWSLEFRYCGYRVLIDSTGRVRLRQAPASIAPTSSP